MFWRIKSLIDKFVEEVKEAVEEDVQNRITKEKEMQHNTKEREREVTEREASWKAELSRREVRTHYSASLYSQNSKVVLKCCFNF